MTASAAPRLRWTFAVLATATGAFALMQSLIIPVLPRIQSELDTDQSTVSWVLTAYLLSAAVCTPILGRLGDVIGKKATLVGCVAALAVGSLLGALAPSVGWLIAARVVQGIGGATLPLSYGIIRDVFPAAHRAQAISVIAALATGGFGLGIVVGGPLVDQLGYPWLFWVPMIVTGAAALGAWWLVPESPVRTAGRLPFGPGLLLASWLVCLLLAVSRGNVWGWTSGRVLVLVAAAVVLAACWLLAESRVRVPMIDLRLMRRRGMWSSCLVTLLAGFGLYAALGFTPQLLQTASVHGYGFDASISESGRIMLPSSVLGVITGAGAAWLIRHLGARTVLSLACACMGTAYASIALFHDHVWQLVVALVVQGVGTGLVGAGMAQVVAASVPADQGGVANGINFNLRTIGGAIGTAVMTGIVTADHVAPGVPAEHGYTVGYLVMAGVLAAGALGSWLIPDLHATPVHATVGEQPAPDADATEDVSEGTAAARG